MLLIEYKPILKGIIYLIENIQNHKKYIGKTSNNDFYKYIKDHFKNAENKSDLKDSKNGKYLYNAIRKYGRQNFTWKILGEIFGFGEKELRQNLNEAEIDCIYHFRTFGSDGEHKDDIYGYNCTKGGDGISKGSIPWCAGKTKKTDIRLQKLSEKLSILKTGVPQTKESNEKRSKKLKGRKFTKEHSKNKSLAQTGEKNHRFGKHQSEEQNKKQSEKMSGKNNFFYGKHHSEETLQKLRKPRKILKLKIISPKNDIFYVNNEFLEFCKKHNLKCPYALSSVAYGKKDNYLGWRAEFYE